MESAPSPCSTDDCPFEVDEDFEGTQLEETEMDTQGSFFANSVPVEEDTVKPEIKMASNIGRQINGLIILPHFHSPAEVIRQGPIIHNLVGPPGPTIRKVHPCPNKAFVIWRPITRSLGPEDGLFKVYPESHNIRTEEELHRRKIDAVSVPIRADQFLIAHGGLWIQQGGSGSGLLMWAGLSTEIIGLHVDKRSLDFVALAYGAGRFLGRDRPFGTTEQEAVILDDPLLERNTKPVSSSIPANTFLDQASHTLEKTEAFLKGLSDPTSLILNSEYGMHPRIAYANVRVQNREGHSTDPELERYFLSALTIRSLLRRLRETPRETIPDFTRKEGLPDETLVKHAILTGRKMYFVETEKSEPGLWLALMSVLPKLQHMPIWQVKLIPGLLNEQPRILDAGERWSRYMSQSSQLYEIWVRELLQGSNPT
ncbi:hypothetical protein N7468_004173 [Penicillium chermesinum]|uniref:Uncharacterized protein n=1 Tax=Penicillium chermesinum TaxID=63820 RepID=A0A9W9P7U8_9EURO|nr:uncharacterized protein N7468_004173 [Penicillium chermesinum]KAJ5239554.1 hypothetical protein N7468_004173 [Penicillium chermesinum]